MTIKVESNSIPEIKAAVVTDSAPPKEVKEESAAAPETEAAETADAPEAPETEEKDDETSEGENKDQPAKPKKGFKKRIDKLTRKLSEQEKETERWREMALKANPQPEPKPALVKSDSSDKPKVDDFDSHSDFIEALTDWKVAENKKKDETAKKDQELKAQRQSNVDTYNSKLKTVQEKYSDYDDVLEESEVVAPAYVLSALFESENGPELTYLLAKHEDELARISKLSPAAALLELGKFEAKHISSAAKEITETKTTKAPSPITPVGSKGSAVSFKSLADPNLSQSEYEALRAKQRAQKRA